MEYALANGLTIYVGTTLQIKRGHEETSFKSMQPEQAITIYHCEPTYCINAKLKNEYEFKPAFIITPQEFQIADEVKGRIWLPSEYLLAAAELLLNFPCHYQNITSALSIYVTLQATSYDSQAAK